MQDHPDTAQKSALVAVLDWYRAMGVDAATGSSAHDWLAHGSVAPGAGFAWPSEAAATAATAGPERERRAPIAPTAPTAPLGPAKSATRAAPASPLSPVGPVGTAPPPAFARPIASSGAVEIAAREAARGAASLSDLEAALQRFDGCPLKALAKNLCFFRGAPAARLMLIGEAPGREEDLAGKPFVGRAGQLLDKMLAAADLSEADVHITNIIYWRPPGNRPPTLQEAEACRPFLERQVELVAPQFVALLGGAAAKQVLGTEDGIMKLRGRWQDLNIGTHACRAIATLHPAFLLRSPAYKRQAWRDILAIRTAMNFRKPTDH